MLSQQLLQNFLLTILPLFVICYFLMEKFWSRKVTGIAIHQEPEKPPNISKPPIEEPLRLPKSEFSLEDIEWLVHLQQTVVQNLSNLQFDVTQLADELALSSRHLHRRIHLYTGLSTQKYIQEVRLKTAKELLEIQAYSSVKAVAYEVGYKDVKYFGQLYKKRFGKLPSSYFRKANIRS